MGNAHCTCWVNPLPDGTSSTKREQVIMQPKKFLSCDSPAITKIILIQAWKFQSMIIPKWASKYIVISLGIPSQVPNELNLRIKLPNFDSIFQAQHRKALRFDIIIQRSRRKFTAKIYLKNCAHHRGRYPNDIF